MTNKNIARALICIILLTLVAMIIFNIDLMAEDDKRYLRGFFIALLGIVGHTFYELSKKPLENSTKEGEPYVIFGYFMIVLCFFFNALALANKAGRISFGSAGIFETFANIFLLLVISPFIYGFFKKRRARKTEGEKLASHSAQSAE